MLCTSLEEWIKELAERKESSGKALLCCLCLSGLFVFRRRFGVFFTF